MFYMRGDFDGLLISNKKYNFRPKKGEICTETLFLHSYERWVRAVLKPSAPNRKEQKRRNPGHLCSLTQFSSVAQSCPTLCDLMNRSTPGLPVHHKLPEFTQTHADRVGNAIQSSHPLSSPSHPAPNPYQHQGLFQWVNSSHEVAKLLEFQLQHQSFQWTPRTDLL